MIYYKKYLILYYLSFVIILLLFLLSASHLLVNSNIDNGMYFESINSLIIYFNIIITFILTILLIRKRKIVGKIIFPISFIIYTTLIIIGFLLFNDRVIVPYIHFGYYANLIIYSFTLLNIYTILSIKKGDSK